MTPTKSTLADIPIYYLSMLTMPVSVDKKLDFIQQRFLWGEIDGKRKYYLLIWDKVEQPIQFGGLSLIS